MQHPNTLSLWHDTMPHGAWDLERPSLERDIEADVAIVGGGYTGLWTAYYLSRRDPSLRVVVLDAAFVGFGASGRNGGWCSALLPMGLDTIAASHGRDAAVQFQQAMHGTVDEVGTVAAREGIDCHYAKGGYVHMARTPVQLRRLRHELDDAVAFGFGDDDMRWLDADEARARVGATDVLGAVFTPHCAAIHPARLVRGLAEAVERAGVTIFEHTPARQIESHRVRTDHGTITAGTVVRATEAFTAALPGNRRAVAPIYSLMIATEPLPAELFAEIGLAERCTFDDGRRMIIYGQRTADDRLAFGGRGAPYHFRSSMKPAHERDDAVHLALHATLRELFPAIGEAAVTHRWGGAVAATRDWWCSVGLDRAGGTAWGGGYLGDGVATSNLAGRTLADLITGTESALVGLPWVDHRSRDWEPEPLRWAGINGVTKLIAGADRTEDRTGRRDPWRGGLVERLTN
jgi:glycine/D-amino acid oxidase-like deaminating enzyme